RDLDAYGDDGDGSATATGGTTASAETADVDGDDGATAGGDDQVGLTEFDDGEDVETGDDGEDVETGGDGEDVETGGDGEDGDEPATPADAVVATARPDEETGAVEVVVDQREMDSSIPRDLSRRDAVDVRLETLEVGDYVLSDRAVVERKSVADFVDTLTGGDRSLFEQVGDAASHYARPVVVIEGTGLYEERNVHPNAIRGAVASLAVDFGASVLRTDDESDTTELLAQIADREQTESDREVSVHGEKGAKTLAEQQEYVVSSIADVGPVTATALLEAFGSVEAVMTATHDDLTDVAGVGEVTAGRIREVVGGTYDPD
ncbi:Hef nuclease, partial [Halobacteriales archaeon SW_7_68_16]